MNHPVAVKYTAVAGAIKPAIWSKSIFTGVIGSPGKHTAKMGAPAIEGEIPRLDTRKVETLFGEVSYGTHRHSLDLFHAGDLNLGAEASRFQFRPQRSY